MKQFYIKTKDYDTYDNAKIKREYLAGMFKTGAIYFGVKYNALVWNTKREAMKFLNRLKFNDKLYVMAESTKYSFTELLTKETFGNMEKKIRFTELLLKENPELKVDGINIAGELCWKIKKPSKIAAYRPVSGRLVFPEMHISYDLWNKFQEVKGIEGGHYAYKNGGCALYGDKGDIDILIQKYKMKVETIPKTYTRVTWAEEPEDKDWTAEFWTKKWLKWYTDLLKKGNQEWEAKAVHPQWNR